jgi:hypothetical protein
MFEHLIELIGKDAFDFIKSVAPNLIEIPLNSVLPKGFPRLLLHTLLYVFEHQDERPGTLGKKILKDGEAESKLKIIEMGICGILRGLDAANDTDVGNN